MTKFKPIRQAQGLQPVDPNPDFVAQEKKLLDEWYSSGVVDKYLHKNDSSSKFFSFLDGPITANNPMGVHHAWGRTYKDLWQRYKNMQGYKQRFQNGFDCQGLWVEVEVEKELGLKSKRDIENLVPGDPKASIAKFVQACKERVMKYSKMQTEQSKRLGYFMDWENSYYTMSEDNNYMIWTFLKKCHERGLIYKGHDSVPWCPRCSTAISQHEMLTEDYKELTHQSVYVQYPIVGRQNEYLLVWTTTPWTLPANVAIAVDPQQDYVLAANEGGSNYYLSKMAAEGLKLRVIREVGGEEIVGREYESPFDNLPRVKKALEGYKHKVVATDPQIMPISEEEGTGLVHTAPGAGTEDFQLGKRIGLPVVEVIDEEANYLDGLEQFSGKNAASDPEIILDYLKKVEGGRYLFDVVPYTHRYPACWRCKTELVWRVVDEWYIAMDEPKNKEQTTYNKGDKRLREQMRNVARKINWIPEFGLKRELDWLENMRDWLISKKRYWGLALPIWVCEECEKFVVIGGKEELEARAVEGLEEFRGHTPHRPYIDEVKLKCDCGGVMTRISDVGNPWLDAGIVPYSTISTDNKSEPLYKTDKGQWRRWFPADFITESFPGQFKNWFYSLIAMSTVLEGKEPFKTVFGYATLLAEDGRPMHKSWGNAIEFNESADKIGVDIVRWMYAKQDPTQNMLFGYKGADETRRSFFLILWNVYNFFVTYANLDGWANSGDLSSSNVLDKWIKLRLREVQVTVSEGLDKYDGRAAILAIESFVQHLSLWYVRRSRDRVGPNSPDGQDKDFCYSTLYFVLVELSKLLAPFVPFIAEKIYTNLTGEESVHLTSWPKLARISQKEQIFIWTMWHARKVVEQGHAQRKLAGIPVRQPLAKMFVKHDRGEYDSDLIQLIKDELNVKEVEWEPGSNKEIVVKLDTNITPELEEEGKTRELARRIQDERKRLDTPLGAKVNVTSDWLPKNLELLAWLKQKTLTQNLIKGDTLRVEEV